MKTYSPEAFFTPSTIHSTNRLSMRQGAHVTGSLGKYTKFAQQSPHPHPGLSSSACNEHFWVHLFLPRLPCRSLVGNYYSCCNLIKLANFFDCTTLPHLFGADRSVDWGQDYVCTFHSIRILYSITSFSSPYCRNFREVAWPNGFALLLYWSLKTRLNCVGE